MPDNESPEKGSISSTLTDGTGISKLTSSKLIKDFVADILLGAVTGLGLVNIVGIDSALAQPAIAAVAVGNALISALYRVILRWTAS